MINGVMGYSQGINPGDETRLIQEFENSTDFSFLNQNPLVSRYELKEGGAYVKYEDQTSKPVIFVPMQFRDTKMLAGYFEAAKAKTSYTQIPNKGKYFVIWRDYSQFNFDAQAGTIDYYDANYDYYLSGTVHITPSGFTSWITYDMPEDIRRKYNHGISPGPDKTLIEKTHPCDLDKNGDVTFGECYKCIRDACNSNPDCMAICDFFGPLCRSQIRISCAIIAMFY